MNPPMTVLCCALLLIPASGAQTAAARQNPAAAGNAPVENKAPVTLGEVVSQLPVLVSGVYQARDNTYWFGSSGDAIYRHDGKSITRFTAKDGLPGVRAGGFQEDKAGNLCFAMWLEAPPNPQPTQRMALCKFDGKSFSRIKLPENDSPEEGWKYKPDDLWYVGGQDTGVVYRYDGTVAHRLRFPRTKAGDLATLPRDQYPNAKYSPYDVYTIFKDSREHMWFGTACLGACRFDGTSFAWISPVEANFGKDDSFGLRSIIEDKDGKYWFTTTRERFAVNPGESAQRDAGTLSYRKEPGLGEQDPVQFFTSAIKDRKGDLWLAVLGGAVFHYDGKGLTRYLILHDGKPIWINSIYEDRQGGLWVGTNEHGLYKFNGKSFEPFTL